MPAFSRKKQLENALAIKIRRNHSIIKSSINDPSGNIPDLLIANPQYKTTYNATKQFTECDIKTKKAFQNNQDLIKLRREKLGHRL